MLPDLGNVARTRRVLGLTQKELADIAQVSQSLIAKIESGKTDPTYSKAKAVLDTLERLQTREKGKVVNIMTEPVMGVQTQDTVRRAIEIMNREAISQMPVYEDEKLVGNIHEGTLIRIVSEGTPLESLLDEEVGNVMEEPMPTVAQDTPIELATSLLNYYPAVLVTVKGEVAGIIARADLLKTQL